MLPIQAPPLPSLCMFSVASAAFLVYWASQQCPRTPELHAPIYLYILPTIYSMQIPTWKYGDGQIMSSHKSWWPDTLKRKITCLSRTICMSIYSCMSHPLHSPSVRTLPRPRLCTRKHQNWWDLGIGTTGDGTHALILYSSCVYIANWLNAFFCPPILQIVWSRRRYRYMYY
jgi:hypothetical protein